MDTEVSGGSATRENRPVPTEAILLAELRALLAELHPDSRTGPPVTLGSDLARDLALDSLARAELLLRLSRAFRVTLPDRLIGEAGTPADLLAAIEAAGPAPTWEARPWPEAPLPSAEEPRQAATLIDVLAFHVERHPDRPHLRLCLEPERETVLTYADLDRGARSVAAGLCARGLEAGDRVALMLPTGCAFFFAFLGTLLAGGIPVPLYPPFRRSQIEDYLERQVRILTNAEPALLIAGDEITTFAELLRDRVPALRAVVTPEELARAEPDTHGPAVIGASVALIQYTSGSTGDPKGVVLTHANLLANIRAMGSALGASSTDIVVSWLPLYHDMGLIGCWLGSLYFGAPAVIIPPLAFLADPGRWLRAIHRHRGTISAAPNFAYELCLKTLRDEDLAGLDLGSLRVMTNGAEPVSAATLERFARRFEPAGLRATALAPVYGLAECSVGLAFPPLGRGPLVDRIDRATLARTGLARRAGPDIPHPLTLVACGQPLPGHQIRIVDEAGLELPERVEGHLQFKGPSATAGYFRNPEKNRVLFDGDWLNSGDLAYIAGGDVYVTGRSKDLIIRAGRKIYPQELEELAGTVPGIRKGCVAAFASPDPKTGTERLVLAAETRLHDGPERDALVRAVIDRLAGVLEQPPDEVLLCPPHSVPKTSSGKIRRTAARARYEAGDLARPTPLIGALAFRVTRASVARRVHRALRRAGGLAYAASWWTILALLGALVWPLVLLLPARSWRHAVLRNGARTFLRLTATPLSVSGEVPRGSAGIIVANHASYLDALVLTAILPGCPVFLAKQELAAQRIAGPFLRRLGTAFVHRGEAAGVADAEMVLGRIRAGEQIVVFPEGTFTRSPGMLPFHLGAFQIACRARGPIVPVTISGTRSILRADQWFPHRGRIGVHVATPIVPAGEDFHAAIRLRDATRAAILARSGEPDLADQAVPAPSCRRPDTRSEPAPETDDDPGLADALTIPGLLQEQAARRPTMTAYLAFDRRAGDVVPWSWSAVAARVDERCGALASEGLQPGDRIALWLPNGLEWICFDQAALALGLVVVPLFPDDATANVSAILADSGAVLLVAQDAEAWRRLGPEPVPSVRRVILLEAPEPLPKVGRVRALDRWLADRDPKGRRAPPLDPDALATIVYTSGTTGQPKGVMLTHRNLIGVARAVLDRNPGTDRDVFLSYLPLAHVFERVVGCYLPLVLGAKVYFARSVEHVRKDLLAARPTILLVVPSLLDRLHETVRARARRSAFEGRLLDLTLTVGWQVFEAKRDGRKVGLLRALLWRVLRRGVAEPILASFGGRVRLAVSGGAPLSPDTARFCLSLGFPLVEGYGLTEAASAVTGFSLGTTVPGSVGPPLPGITLRIADTGEILVRSPGVMRGYWGLPERTAEVLQDGWLRTGDLGALDGGRLVFRGRLKDGIVLSTGEKIWPDGIEAAIRRDPLFQQVLLVGDGQRRPTVLAVVEPKAWRQFAADLGLDPGEDHACHSLRARRAALDRIAAALHSFPPTAQVSAVQLVREPWTIENGLLTPTQKVRRAAVLRRYAAEVAEMQGEDAIPP